VKQSNLIATLVIYYNYSINNRFHLKNDVCDERKITKIEKRVNTTEIINENAAMHKRTIGVHRLCCTFFGHITRKYLVNRFKARLAAALENLPRNRRVSSTT